MGILGDTIMAEDDTEKVRAIDDGLAELRERIALLEAALADIMRLTNPADESHTVSRYPIVLRVHDIANAALKGQSK